MKPKQPLARGLKGLVSVLWLVAVTAVPAFAEEDLPTVDSPPERPPTKAPLLGWTITPGIGVRVVTLDVTRKSDGYTGTLTNDGSFGDPIYLSLNIETPSWMISDRIGFSIRSRSETFEITRQEVPSATTQSGTDYVSLGTSVSGYYSYIGPTLFHRTVDRSGDTRWGVGYGYWKTWFDGDIILAPNGAAAPGMPRVRINGSVDGDTGPIFFLQGRANKYVFEIAISRVTFSSSDYETTLSELGMSVGYAVTF